jgi:hypothetical protein
MADERTIFNEALARPAGPQRAGYLDAACAGDKALRTRVDALLAAHAAAGQFLESPPPGLTTSSEDTAGNPSRGGERPGAMVGPYKLLEQLGEGGIGVVFMAEQLTPVRR